MSIFNSFAALAGGGEVETGTVNPASSSPTSITINFQNSHTKRPFVVIATCEYYSSNSTCQNYIIDFSQMGVNITQVPDYGLAIKVRGRNTGSVFTTYSSSTISDVLTNNKAVINRYSNSYAFPSSGYAWNWIAIWL